MLCFSLSFSLSQGWACKKTRNPRKQRFFQKFKGNEHYKMVLKISCYQNKLIFLLLDIFICLKGRIIERGRNTEQSYSCWFTPTAGAGWILGQEPGSSSRSPTWVQGSKYQACGPSSATFTSIVSESWITSGAAKTPVVAQTGYQCHRQQFHSHTTAPDPIYPSFKGSI